MRIVLDSNEYILGLDTTEGPSPSSRLLVADFMKVYYIVSENRHIYRDLKAADFVTLTAQDFLDLVEE